MILLALLLALDAVLHGFLIYRFGTNQNLPFLIFAFVDAILAIAVFLAWPYALWATLVLSAFGLIGLTVTFNKPVREKAVPLTLFIPRPNFRFVVCLTRERGDGHPHLCSTR